MCLDCVYLLCGVSFPISSQMQFILPNFSKAAPSSVTMETTRVLIQPVWPKEGSESS